MSSASATKHLHSKRAGYSGREKGMIIFLIGALILMLIMSIVHLSAFEGATERTFRLLINPTMRKSNILIIGLTLLLLAWNGNHAFKRTVHQRVGFKENDGMINFGGLAIIFGLLIGISDTLLLLQENFSYRIQVPLGIAILQGYILIGMVWTIFFAYKQNKQKKKLHDITIAHEADEKQRKAFQHVEKEFGSLFQRDDTETDYTDDQYDEEGYKTDAEDTYSSDDDNTHDADDDEEERRKKSNDLLRAKLLG